ncbi:ATP-binding cassette domain-containing protein [Vogesella oryzae]|uniref:ATP-binding cassette domain-containing protein n=1 Tax=Vogesella oryzae TaxID=1735285 RepID=UPI00158279A4|nr:hypothetical protein [Vogesella oryzae]
MLCPAYELQLHIAPDSRATQSLPLYIPANRLTIITGGTPNSRRQLLASLAGSGDFVCGQLFGQAAHADRLRRLTCLQQSVSNHCRQQLGRYVLQQQTSHWWRRGNDNNQQLANQLLRDFGLLHLAEQRFCQLTSAEQQLATIIRCLVSTAPVVLLNEPATSLCLTARRQLLQQLQRLALTGRTIVITLQDRALASQLADHLIDLDQNAATPLGDTTRTDETARHALEDYRRSA